MSDSTPSTSTPTQGRSSNVATNHASGSVAKPKENQDGRSKGPVAKLNPDAKDYVPRTGGNGSTQVGGPSSSTSSSQSTGPNSGATHNTQAGGSGPDRSRNRRKRNPDATKSGASNSGNNGTSQTNKVAETGQDTANGHATGTNNGTTATNSASGRGRNRNRGRNTRQPIEGGGARIDDDDHDAGTHEHPVESPTDQAGGSGTGGANKGRRHNRERRSKDKEASQSSSSKPQQSRGGKERSVAIAAEGQAESSSSAGNTNNNKGAGNGGRRQRNRRGLGELNGRTFPNAPNESEQTEQSSGTQQRTAQRRTPRGQSRRTKRTADEDRDLMTNMVEGLTSSTYECMVCWDVIRPAHKIWNCQVCWAAFHLDCLSTWATKSTEDANNHGAGWRCPGCQNSQVSIPKEYVCFCGKVSSPDFNRYFTPHSCGELCGRSRECPHPCNIPCHPGPCPPCGGLGPVQSCYCGNETFQLRCVDTDFSFQTGKSCDRICGELLGCGKHTCTSVCHSGLCPPCGELLEQKCYCGKHERQGRCGDGEPKASLVDGELRTGYYQCHEICHRPLACGNHDCTKACHPLDEELGQCPARPEAVQTCPCGSKSIETLLMGKSRTSCKDPIPVCGGLCKKPLSCGHRCMQKCHLGECQPCRMTVTVDCRCGSTRIQKICSEMGMDGDQLPTCDRPCRSLRACGKHQCTARCCPGKNVSKDKKGGLAALEAHICPLVCGKKLQCGVHNCEMLCHKGHCDPCLDSSYEELSCACGRTVKYPPIPCGTPVPRCRYSCTRPRACGHTSFSNHPCHPDSEPCPPCIMFVSKQCMCEKSTMPNVPCHKTNPSCGKTCGKRLSCNMHNCIKSCHAGECLSSSPDICTQLCTKTRKSCNHRCGVACHGDTPCPEDQPCQVIVASSCKCGHLTLESACNASTDNPYDGKPRTIKCNDYCLIAERNKRIAVALEIEESASAPGPRIPEYDSYVLDYASANMEFTLKVEKQLGEWVADTSKPILYFAPMKGHRRKFVHELAAHYNVISESVDVEPYRSVTVRRQSDTSVPGLLASQACRQKRPATTSTASTTVEQLRKPQIKDPVNAIYLHELAFGLTRTELTAQLAPVFGTIKYGIRWLTDDDAVLVPHPGSMQMDELEAVLIRLRTNIKAVAAKGNLCERVELCWVNKEGEVVSHTNLSGGSQKRFFSTSQGNQWIQKTATRPKVENAFALLDDDERIAAAKRVEEERIFRAKEAAGTLSNDAWEEESSSAFPAPVDPQTVQSQVTKDPAKFIVVERGALTDEVVDDWQELVDDDEVETKNDDDEAKKIATEAQESDKDASADAP